MKATEFLATFSNSVRETAVTQETVWLATSRELHVKLDQIEGFAERSGCRLMTWERDLCSAIRAELAVRS